MFKNVDSVYVDYIHSVEVGPANKYRNGTPIIPVNGTIDVKFDDGYGNFIEYFYTVYHCTKDWEITPDIEKSMYMIGQDEIEIEQFGGSTFTNFDYYHYDFSFPNRDMRLLWSGNYILVVYDRDGTVAFTKRFYIYEDLVDISIKHRRPISSLTYNTHQALEVKVDVSKLNPRNPAQDIYMFAWQNNFNENGIENVMADFVSGSALIYNNQNLLEFKGYKEYRLVDVRTTELAGLGIGLIEIEDEEVYMATEAQKFRDLKSNFTDWDQNGTFVIQNKDPNAQSTDYSSEYPIVMFTLKSEEPLPNDVYLIGEFSDYKLYPKYKMKYLQEEQAYLVETRLKQGVYDYLFAMENRDGTMDIERIEGSSYETENLYHVMIYHRTIDLFYDRIVGYGSINVNPF